MLDVHSVITLSFTKTTLHWFMKYFVNASEKHKHKHDYPLLHWQQVIKKYFVNKICKTDSRKHLV